MTRQLFLKSLRQSVLLGAVVVLVALLAPGLAPANDLILDGGSTFTMPPPDSITYDTEIIGDFGQGTLEQSGGTNTITGTDETQGLFLGKSSTGSGIYELSGTGSLSAYMEYIGYEGTGTFTQSGGTNAVTGTDETQGLFLGISSTGRGTYDLQDGSLSASLEYIGFEGTGTFTQSGGTNEVTGDGESTGILALGILRGRGSYYQSGGTTEAVGLYLGILSDSRGTYNLSGGSLSTDYTFIGLIGAGTFTQSGGTHSINGFEIGGEPYGLVVYKGRYDLSGGELSADNILVGPSGTFNRTGGTLEFSDFNQMGGRVTFPELILGDESGSDGLAYHLQDGTLLADTVNLNPNGLFTQTGGTFDFSQVNQNGGTGNFTELVLGINSGSTNNYNLSDGNLSAAAENIGSEGTGTFTQSGGTNTVTGTDDDQGLFLGKSSTGSGTYELSGTGSLSAYMEYIGIEGTGTFTQSGGTNTAYGLLFSATSGSRGTYDLQDGSLSASIEAIGFSGPGTFTQSGGTNEVTGDGESTGILALGFLRGRGSYYQSGGTTKAVGLYLGFLAGSRGTYNLSGGSLSTDYTFIGLIGAGTFNQSGGTHSINGFVLDGEPYGLVVNKGSYNLSGGSLSAPTIQVNTDGVFNVIGGTQTVTGNVINEGAIKTTNTDVTWNGTFTNNGVYTSDPSTQTFEADLVVGSSGYLVAASQDVFIVKGDFKNQSTQNTLWNTAQAKLAFISDGADSDHNLFVPGAELGVNGYADNFAWGFLNITEQNIYLFDSNDVDGGALYVWEILGVSFTDLLVTNIHMGEEGLDLNIYYISTLPGNDYLEGLTYDLTGGGQLIPVPLLQYAFTCYYNDGAGDYYSGYFYDTQDYEVGDHIMAFMDENGQPGYYEITGILVPDTVAVAGQVFVDTYYDSETTEFQAIATSNPVGTDYLGSEDAYIRVADIPEYHFGGLNIEGFVLEADLVAYAYDFTCTFGNGDYYRGRVYAAPEYGYGESYTETFSDENGQIATYAITAVAGGNDVSLAGQVFVDSYYDQEWNYTFTPVHAGSVVGTDYLGSERDYILFDGMVLNRFGVGPAGSEATLYEADVTSYQNWANRLYEPARTFYLNYINYWYRVYSRYYSYYRFDY